MALAPKDTMTVADFLAWAETQADQRYELLDGAVIAMAPERLGHGRAKQSAFVALRTAIARSALACEAFVDCAGVATGDRTVFIPNIVVNCGERPDDELQLVPSPVIVIEILTPSTQRVDQITKLTEYFRIPSLIHYVIVDSAKRAVIHHRRQSTDLVQTALLRAGQITFDPPGLTIALDDLLG